MYNWLSIPFNDLSLQQLYDLIVLRQEVFVVEQNCAYLDADGLDAGSQHILVYDEQQLAAYARLVPSGLAFDCPSIGRVITHANYRRTGLGKELMAYSVTACETIYGKTELRLGAQSHLQAFYGEFNFVATENAYLEDGIPHVEMVKTLR